MHEKFLHRALHLRISELQITGFSKVSTLTISNKFDASFPAKELVEYRFDEELYRICMNRGVLMYLVPMCKIICLGAKIVNWVLNGLKLLKRKTCQ